MVTELLETFLRILPWLMTTLSANVIHYRSLLRAREAAHRKFMEIAATAAGTSRRHFPGSSPEEHELLTFNLMQSTVMRKARYQIKGVHYAVILIYIALFYRILPEIHLDGFKPGVGTAEAVVVGLLSGLITVRLDENRLGEIRTPWRPGIDHESRILGLLWDGIRISGFLCTPFEDCLFYHSWMYRVLVRYVREEDDDQLGQISSFTDVSFTNWSWTAWFTCNAAFAVYNGNEWRSSLLSGLLSLWVIGRKGQFLDGILALGLCRMTVNAWVVVTGQRQFW